MEIIKESCMEAWKNALALIMKKGHDFKDINDRLCREVLNLVITVKNTIDVEEPMNTVKSFEKWVYPEKEEFEHIITSRENIAIYDYSYGYRIFNFQDKLDQINDFIVPLLRKYPNTRRAMISLYDPIKDSRFGNRNMPALVYAYFRLVNDKLNLTFCIRSNDMFIGWPANIYQISILQKFVADKIGKETGDITTISNSAHIFHEHFEFINQIIK